MSTKRRLTGIMFGYPRCCIDAFNSRPRVKANNPRTKGIFDGTGFIPCSKCMTREPIDLLEEIIDKRLFMTYFPFDLDSQGNRVRHGNLDPSFIEMIEDKYGKPVSTLINEPMCDTRVTDYNNLSKPSSFLNDVSLSNKYNAKLRALQRSDCRFKRTYKEEIVHIEKMAGTLFRYVYRDKSVLRSFIGRIIATDSMSHSNGTQNCFILNLVMNRLKRLKFNNVTYQLTEDERN